MKLAEVQQKLKAPKNQFNNFGKYKYRNAEDILEALKPMLGDATVTISDEIVFIGDRYYVKATATFKGDDEHSVSAYAREANEKKGMDEAQITGASSSYARKYALNGLFLIDDTKDADTTNTHDKEPKMELQPHTEQVIDVTEKNSKAFEAAKKKAIEVVSQDEGEALEQKIINSTKLTDEEKNILLSIIDERLQLIPE